MKPLPPTCTLSAGSRGSNVLVGGLFLHQRRRPVPTAQQAATDCSARFANLEFRCQYAGALEVGWGVVPVCESAWACCARAWVGRQGIAAVQNHLNLDTHGGQSSNPLPSDSCSCNGAHLAQAPDQ